MLPWQPTASIQNQKKRAEVLNKIRAFFAARDVLEVETPLLSHATVTDLHLQSFITHYHSDSSTKTTELYLQTSPEFAMKRLLAAGSGPIFQICKAFRNNGESGRFHNPEFSMLEWYRPGFNHHDLMDEVDQLLHTVLNSKPAERVTYAETFERHAKINPHTASVSELKQQTQNLGLTELAGFNFTDKDNWLHLIMTHVIEPNLSQAHPTFIYDFPASQAALAKINSKNTPPTAERFEVYVRGLELANGYHELTNAQEQRQRFMQDLQQRETLGYPAVPVDQFLLAALEHGLPNCAGIALGIDRLVLLAAQAEKIADIINFPLEIA